MKNGLAYFLLVLISAVCIQAEVLSTYQFSQVDLDEIQGFDVAGAATSPNVSVGYLRAGAGFIAHGSRRSWSVTWVSDDVAKSCVDLSSAIHNDSYIEFVVRAKPGYALNLDGGRLTIAFAYSLGGSLQKPSECAVLFSETGFSPDLYNIPLGDVSARQINCEISNQKLSDLTGDQAIRLYFWNPDGEGLALSGINIYQEFEIPGYALGENIILEGIVVPVGGDSAVAQVAVKSVEPVAPPSITPAVKPTVTPAVKPTVKPAAELAAKPAAEPAAVMPAEEEVQTPVVQPAAEAESLNAKGSVVQSVAKSVAPESTTGKKRSSRLVQLLIGVGGFCALVFFLIRRDS